MEKDRRNPRPAAVCVVACRVVLTLLMLVLGFHIGGCAWARVSWQERQFMRKSSDYYSELAHACDAILRSQQLQSDELFEVRVANSKLPTVITSLRPDKLWLTSNSVSLDFGQRGGGFWVGWGPGEAFTNLWTLEANIAGSRKILYSERR